MSHHEFIFGKKQGLETEFVDVNSKKDFPTLGQAIPQSAQPVDNGWGKKLIVADAKQVQPQKQQGRIAILPEEKAFPSLPEAKIVARLVTAVPVAKPQPVVEKSPFDQV